MSTPLIIVVICAFIQVFFTLWCILRMGLARVAAIRKNNLSIAELSLSSTGYPEQVRKLQANAHNQFETPILFFAGAAMAVALSTVNWGVALGAVAYIASRFAHRYVHVGSNRVGARFKIYGIGLLALIVMWASLGLGLIL